MNLNDLLPDYLRENYGNKKVAVHYTSYDGDFEIKEFNNDYDLAMFCLETQAKIWQNGEEITEFTDWCQFARNVIDFVDCDLETKKTIVRNTNHLPQDLIEKYA